MRGGVGTCALMVSSHAGLAVPHMLSFCPQHGREIGRDACNKRGVISPPDSVAPSPQVQQGCDRTEDDESGRGQGKQGRMLVVGRREAKHGRQREPLHGRWELEGVPSPVGDFCKR